MLFSCIAGEHHRGMWLGLREDVKIPTYKPHTNHKKPSVSSHNLAPTSICDLSHSVCWSPLTDLGHISSVTYVCHPLWFVCGHRKRILTSPLILYTCSFFFFLFIGPIPSVDSSSIGITFRVICALHLE